MSIQKGFILTSDFEDQGQKHIVSFGGVSDEGPFELIFTKVKPLFFVEKGCDLGQGVPPFERKSLPLKSFNGQEVDALYFNNQRDLWESKELLAQKGIRTFEADIRSPERFLMERFIYGSIEFSGKSELRNGLLTYIDPQIRAGNYKPNFKVLSLDIETSMSNDLFSIALHQRGPDGEYKKVFMKAETSGKRNDELYFVSSEEELLNLFLREVEEWDPDILIGWHVIGFDLTFLEKKFKQYGLKFNLGRRKSPLIIQEKKGAGYFANLFGRIILDGPPTLRNSFYQFENFKLETVAQELLGVGKDIESKNSLEKVKEIERRFYEDKEGLAKYNLLDCTLVLDIFEKTELLDLIYKRVRISGSLINKLGISTSSFDHFMLPQIHRKSFVAPNVIDITREIASGGGLVKSPSPGQHSYVVVLDFKSLYPTIMRTFKIDPLSRVQSQINTIKSPSGVLFSKTENVLSSLIGSLMEKREDAKLKGNKNLSMAIKILMNSFYGVMGSGGSRFYHADLPKAVTESGQWALKKAISFIEDNGLEVIYGDTDSVFVKFGEEKKEKALTQGKKIVIDLNNYLKEAVAREFKVESFLEIQFDKFYRKLFFPTLRGSDSGAKKKYVGLKVSNGEEHLDFVGMEFVRNDWTELSKKFQYDLYKKWFSEDDIEKYIKYFVEEVKEKKMDNLLTYKKRLTKDPKEYTKNVPPHVKAALLLLEKGHTLDRSIEYVITDAGPFPIELGPTNYNYSHYIDKQIRPLAENVLHFLGKSFDDLISGDQLNLF